MRGDYRTDQRSRCNECAVAVPHDELTMTVEGTALCASCYRTWVERDAHAGFVAGGKRRPGYRLVCPACDAATMETVESEFLLRAKCVRCGGKTSRFRAAAALLPMLLFMIALVFDGPLGVPLVNGVLASIVGLLLVRDIFGRRRHPVASFEQIQQADAAVEKERVGIATGQRPAEMEGPLPLAEAEAAEAEAQAEAEAHAQQDRRVS
jgi:hypothetical protein